MTTTRTRIASAATLCAVALTLGCAPHDSVEAAKSCDELATKGELKYASRCLFDLVNEPARATRDSTYQLWDDDAAVVITSGGRAQVIDGATMREQLISQIPMMEATGMNDTFEEVEYYTADWLAALEETPKEVVTALGMLDQEVIFIRAVHISSKDGERRPFALGMSDVDGKWRIVAHFMEVA